MVVIFADGMGYAELMLVPNDGTHQKYLYSADPIIVVRTSDRGEVRQQQEYHRQGVTPVMGSMPGFGLAVVGIPDGLQALTGQNLPPLFVPFRHDTALGQAPRQGRGAVAPLPPLTRDLIWARPRRVHGARRLA